jgi:DnaK suppressor protein
VTKALPPGKKGGPIVGTKGGALAKQAKPSGNFRAPSLPKGTVKVAGKALSTLGKVGRGLGVAGAALGAADTVNSIVNPRSEGNQQLAKAMAAVNKRFSSNYGPRFKKSGSQPAAKPVAKSQMGPMPALKGGFVNGKLQMTQVAKPKAKPAAKPVAPKAATTPARSSAPSRSSAPARTASRPAAKPKTSASESSMSASDIMKGYGMRVNQTFGAESPSAPKKRQSLREQTAEIKQMIEESKKRQGKG